MTAIAAHFIERHAPGRDAAAEWAASGLMALTGPAAKAPLQPAIDLMQALAQLFGDLAEVSSRVLQVVPADTRLLTERAALMRLARGGRISCNRSCHLLESRDGWIAINLPRESDPELLPAWLGVDGGGDFWPRVQHQVKSMPLAELLESAACLGLAAAAVPAVGDAPPRTGADTPRTLRRQSSPLVVDLSALWAGPLCSHLLQAAGARVIRVESVRRPDPIRHTAPAFFNALNAGKESVVLDFRDPADLRKLRALLARADIVVSSARPRALVQLGLEPAAFLHANPLLLWTAITAHGWQGEDGMRVGFGDDAAVAGGLVAWDDDGQPMFIGDAIADPLTGIAAALATLTKLGRGEGGLIDASLSGCAANIAQARPLADYERGRVLHCNGQWWLRAATLTPIAQPAARAPVGAAAGFGAHTQRVLKEFT